MTKRFMPLQSLFNSAPLSLPLATLVLGVGLLAPDIGQANEATPTAANAGGGERVGVDNGGDFPNSGDVLPSSTYQLEFNYSHSNTGDPSVQSHGIPTLARIGLGSDFELRIGGEPITYVGSNSYTSGTGPYSIGGKYSFWSGGKDSYTKPIAFGIQAQVSLPVGSEAFRGETYVPSASFNMDFKLPAGAIIAINIIGSAPLIGDERALSNSNQWSVGFDVGSKATVFAHGLSEFTVGQEGVNHQLGVAFMGYLNSRSSIFGSTTVGLTDASPNMLASGGIAVRF